tara:strand:+ start:251 stop:637 length:387 start_codon:yes stop_codon:yes gene_type:complete
MNVIIKTGKQLLTMWRASMQNAQRVGKITAKQIEGLEGSLKKAGGLEVNARPQEMYQTIINSHNANGVKRLLPKDLNIQEVGMEALQASKINPGRKGAVRLANKAESQTQKMRRLGFKIKKDPKVREY